MLLDNAFCIFQINFPLTTLMRYDDMLVYSIVGDKTKLLEKGKKIISDNNLELQLEENNPKAIFKNTIVVLPKAKVNAIQ